MAINLKSLVSDGFLKMLVGQLDMLMTQIFELATSGEEPDHVTIGICWNIVHFKDELMGLAMKSTTPWDDRIMTEFIEAAEKILPAEYKPPTIAP